MSFLVYVLLSCLVAGLAASPPMEAGVGKVMRWTGKKVAKYTWKVLW